MIGTAGAEGATKVLMLGSGELGKEVVIEFQRLGIEVIACDRYENAPAMQVAHRSHVIDMTDGGQIRYVCDLEKPDYIVPEIEAIDTQALVDLELDGWTVIPTARAVNLTMNREGIRTLAAEELGLKTSPYGFADTIEEAADITERVGYPCIIKPVMSSSGKGQTTITDKFDLERAWDYSQTGGRNGASRVIIEGFVDFDYEITLLTVRHIDGISFCQPIGHIQEDGDYRVSWQPQYVEMEPLNEALNVATRIVDNLCGDAGRGIFGVELFIKGNEVYFSEVSPRPHDTGLVTLISQDISEFALHTRAILGLPIPRIETRPGASVALLAEGTSDDIQFDIEQALIKTGTEIRLFGKPEVNGRRRVGVVLATDKDVNKAKEKALYAAEQVDIIL